MQWSAIRVMDLEHTIDRSDNGPEEVPQSVIAGAKAAFGQRVASQTAVLVWDSLVDEGASASHHHLRFERPPVWIEVSVSVIGGWSHLHGVMHPTRPARVELHFRGGGLPILAEVTRSAFRFARFRPGLVRLRLAGPEGTQGFFSDWFYV
jgi:hypothetical protein